MVDILLIVSIFLIFGAVMWKALPYIISFFAGMAILTVALYVSLYIETMHLHSKFKKYLWIVMFFVIIFTGIVVIV